MTMSPFVVIIFMLTIVSRSYGQTSYKIGVGIADITGPAADIVMFGYAQETQTSAGIHFRTYARSFIIDDSNKRILIVSCDLGALGQIVKVELIRQLQLKYNNTYRDDNVLLSATHTHSTPGGYFQYVLYNIPSSGFVKDSFDAIVTGVLLSIDRAHVMAQKTRGNIYYNAGQLQSSNINRSPTAYAVNPAEERNQYQYNVDKYIQVLKFVSAFDGKPIGALIYFPVHCTSMNNTNQLISGDNKGYASMLFEQSINGPGTLIGKGPFVAGFPTANIGDVSPNTRGPHCMDTGLPCDNPSSTCGGVVELCTASGPGVDMFDSTRIIGMNQFVVAKQLFDSANLLVTGPINYVHQFVNMSNQTVKQMDGKTQSTCLPSMGEAFAAGTTDGPGLTIPIFTQSVNTSNPFYALVSQFVSIPSPGLANCQSPKPILVPTGELHAPYDWQPTIVPIQILKIGQILNVALPGEFTTMSGRRIRDMVYKISGSKYYILLTGLSNIYTSYVTTPEEYSVQRYEGGSTIFGPFTLPAYMNLFAQMTSTLVNNNVPTTNSRLQPPNFLIQAQTVTFAPNVTSDTAPPLKNFGDVLQDINSSYRSGQVAIVTFVSANPRNDLRLEGTFLTVERLINNNKWLVIATDANWETRFYWIRTNPITMTSNAEIRWYIPMNAHNGVYRIRHFNAWRSVVGTVTQFVGTSSNFTVTS